MPKNIGCDVFFDEPKVFLAAIFIFGEKRYPPVRKKFARNSKLCRPLNFHRNRKNEISGKVFAKGLKKGEQSANYIKSA